MSEEPVSSQTSLAAYVANASRAYPVVHAGGVPWLVDRRMLCPAAPPHTLANIRRDDVHRAIRQTGALVARWNDQWDVEPCDWWWVCCDRRDYQIDELGKNARRDVRRGLRSCEVRRVDSDYFAEHGYAVDMAAYEKFGTRPEYFRSREHFAEYWRSAAEYPGRQMWGAFVGDRLVAYFSCLVIDDMVSLATAKSDPEYHPHCVNNALVYELTRHYLAQPGIRYVTDGSRTVGHATQIQDFLLRMGYRRIYCPLRVAFHPALSALLRLRVPAWGSRLGLGRLSPRLMERLQGVARLAEIAASCERSVGGGGQKPASTPS